MKKAPLTRNIIILCLKKKQSITMDKYNILEDMQTNLPECYSIFQSKMDYLDWKAELIRRKLYELEK